MINRVISLEDANYCDELLTLLIQDEKKYDNSIDDKFTVKDYFKNVIKDDSNILLSYKVDGKIVGYTYLKPIKINDLNGYLIDGIYVIEKYRGKKIGTKLLKEAIEISKKNNAKFIDINVLNENKEAKKLYEKLGFFEFKINMKKNI